MRPINIMRILGGKDYRIDNKNLLEKPAYNKLKVADTDNDGSITIDEYQNSRLVNGKIQPDQMDSGFFARGIDRVANNSSSNDEQIGTLLCGIDDIAGNGDASATPVLTRLLQDQRSEVRKGAAKALGEIAQREKNGTNMQPAVHSLIVLASRDEDPDVRQSAIGALGFIGGSNASMFLRDTALNAKNEDDRASACVALGHIGGPAAKRVLEKIVSSPNESDWVKMNAQGALDDLNAGGQG